MNLPKVNPVYNFEGLEKLVIVFDFRAMVLVRDVLGYFHRLHCKDVEVTLIKKKLPWNVTYIVNCEKDLEGYD